MTSPIQKIIRNNPDAQLIQDAFAFAKESYKNEKWLTGEDYIDHAERLGLILHEMGVDPKTVAAGILYNVANISNATEQKRNIEKIEGKFGAEIAKLAERASELNKVYYSIAIDIKEKKSSANEKIENIRKMFLAISQDIRVILIKLAARIDGMYYIGQLPKEMQALYATETMQIFSPIANRLGLGAIKRDLDDLAFAYLFPDQFKWLREHITEKYEERERYLKDFIPHLKKIFHKEKIGFLDINYRVKSYWSTYQKLTKKYDMDFEKVHDLVAIRVIVKDVETCYKVLGIVHKYYKPISQEINDYIAKPKHNGYQSLHTTVFLNKDRVSEIQIRTEQMHKEAEYGICAHWSYKEHISLQANEKTFGWTKEIPEFWKHFKINFFSDQVFVFTPMGDVITLPKGSTPVDFAYAIHSEVGNHCEFAKIDGKIIPLSEVLKNGDVVEIVINKKRKPSQDWLKFVKTDFAKSHIRKVTTLSIPASLLSIPSYIKKKIVEISEKAKKRREEKIKIKKEKPSQIYLAGQKGMLVHIAKCCLPKPTDHVRAYLAKQRAAVLHEVSCSNLKKIMEKFPEKVVDASWK